MDKTSKESRLLLGILEVMEDFALEIERLSSSQADLSEAVEGLDDAIGGMEELLFDDDDEGENAADSPGYKIEPVDEGSFIEYECPHCANKIYYDANAFNLNENHLCPECGKNLFPIDDAADGKKKQPKDG